LARSRISETNGSRKLNRALRFAVGPLGNAPGQSGREPHPPRLPPGSAGAASSTKLDRSGAVPKRPSTKARKRVCSGADISSSGCSIRSVAACYQAPSRAIAHEVTNGIRPGLRSHAAIRGLLFFEDDFEACIAHLQLPVTHRRTTRTTNLLERLFVEERRRLKIVPNGFGETAKSPFSS
jgi:hypothetical protein